MAAVTPFHATRKSLPLPTEQPSSDMAPADMDLADMDLGMPGFRFRDLFEPARLRDLYDVFCTDLTARAPDVAASYEAYRTNLLGGAGVTGSTASRMTAEQVSHVLLAVTPFVSASL